MYEAVSSTSQYYLFHAAGLIPGLALQGEVHDLAIYTLFLDVRVVVVHADIIRANSTEKELSEACMVAGFEGECEKSRVVCAVLENGHYDLGVVFRPEAQAVFENGPEWESARSLILHYLPAKKAKPQPKVFWTPSAPLFPVSAPTPLLNALREAAKVAPLPARHPSTSTLASTSVITTSTATSTASVTASTSPTSTTATCSTSSVATSATTSASVTTPVTAATSAATTAVATAATAAIPRTNTGWVLKAKKNRVFVFTRAERWDLERVDFVLDKLSSLSPGHQDVHYLRLVKKHADKDGFLSVDFFFAKRKSAGRVFSQTGFQRCTKATRAFCSARFYVEDDLVNAFPTILSQVFKQAGLKTPFLDEYVARREELFQELRSTGLDRDDVKFLFLLSLHGGNYRKSTDCIVPFLQQFQAEVRSCAQLLLALPAYADLKAHVTEHRNPIGSAIGLIVQLGENKIMAAKTVFTEDCKLRVATDLFDGHLREIGNLDLVACSKFVEGEDRVKSSFCDKVRVGHVGSGRTQAQKSKG